MAPLCQTLKATYIPKLDPDDNNRAESFCSSILILYMHSMPQHCKLRMVCICICTFSSRCSFQSPSALAKVQLWRRKFAAIMPGPIFLIFAPQDKNCSPHSGVVPFECVPAELPAPRLCGQTARIPVCDCTPPPWEFPSPWSRNNIFWFHKEEV